MDDDPTILDAVSQTLELVGYQVATAPNGADALTVLETFRPCVVLLDMRMPIMDGWAFARAVRQRQLAVKIVVMTATTNIARWAEEIDADGLLAKPFDLETLLDVVERQCGPAPLP